MAEHFSLNELEGVDAKEVWDGLKNQSIPIIDKWMTIPDISKWDGCEQTDCNRFGAADGIYIYQKVILSDETTGAVIDRMLEDLNYVVSKF